MRLFSFYLGIAALGLVLVFNLEPFTVIDALVLFLVSCVGFLFLSFYLSVILDLVLAMILGGFTIDFFLAILVVGVLIWNRKKIVSKVTALS